MRVFLLLSLLFAASGCAPWILSPPGRVVHLDDARTVGRGRLRLRGVGGVHGVSAGIGGATVLSAGGQANYGATDDVDVVASGAGLVVSDSTAQPIAHGIGAFSVGVLAAPGSNGTFLLRAEAGSAVSAAGVAVTGDLGFVLGTYISDRENFSAELFLDVDATLSVPALVNPVSIRTSAPNEMERFTVLSAKPTAGAFFTLGVRLPGDLHDDGSFGLTLGPSLCLLSDGETTVWGLAWLVGLEGDLHP